MCPQLRIQCTTSHPSYQTPDYQTRRANLVLQDEGTSHPSYFPTHKSLGQDLNPRTLLQNCK